MISVRFALIPAIVVGVVCLTVDPSVAGFCTLDGSARSNNPLTTSMSPDEIVLLATNYALGSMPSITGVSGCSLTWTKRMAWPANGVFGGTYYADIEEWVAKATSTLSSCTPVVSWTPDGTNNLYVVFGVNGAASPSAPFDSNSSLPSESQDLSGNPGVAITTGVSTNNPTDFIFSWCTDWSDAAECFHDSGPAGFTFINFNLNAASINTWYKGVSNTQVNTSVPSTSGNVAYWASVADAIACGGTVSNGLMQGWP
jgi:hypothetical protein